MVISKPDYCYSVSAPYKKGDTEALQKVQKMAIEILLALRRLAYPVRLKAFKLMTSHYRQIRGDMIESYKIVSGKYDNETTPTLPMSDTRTTGNDLRL